MYMTNADDFSSSAKLFSIPFSALKMIENIEWKNVCVRYPMNQVIEYPSKQRPCAFLKVHFSWDIQNFGDTSNCHKISAKKSSKINTSQLDCVWVIVWPNNNIIEVEWHL